MIYLINKKLEKLIIISGLAIIMAALFIAPARPAQAKTDVFAKVKVRAPRFSSYASIEKRFLVRWKSPEVTIGHQVVQFRVVYRRKNDRQWRALPALGAITTTARRAWFSGEPGETYEFRVKGETAKGRLGPPSFAETMVPVDDDQNRDKKYRGDWVTSRTKRYYLRTEHQSAKAGSSLTYSFDGTRVFLMGSKGPKRGQAKIFVDGVNYGTVDFRARTYRTRRLLWSSPSLKPISSIRRHRLKVVVVGTRGRPRIGIDALAQSK